MQSDPAPVLGEPAASHILVLLDVLKALGPRNYEFMSTKDYDVLLKKDWRDAQRVYWLEILYRAHFGAVASLVRTARWIDAMLALTRPANYTAFMAAYRGCLEAAADSFHTFGSVAGWLTEVHTVIRETIAGRVERQHLFKELEDELIHFTHARHVAKDEEVDPALRAKQTKKYLSALADRGLPEVWSCYRTLCDVTHPGVGSVRCYADPYRTASGTGFRLRMDGDADLIQNFCAEVGKVSERMTYYGVVPPILVLRILNEFNLKEVFTDAVAASGVERQPAWKHFSARLNDPRPPETRRLGLS